MAPRNDGRQLLLCQRERKFSIAHARRKTFDEFRHCILAVGTHQFGQRREQAGLRQAVAIDAVVPRLRPGLVEIAQRRLLLFVIGQRIAAGYDADFTVVDLKRSETMTDAWVASRAGWTPYDGVRVKGWPVGTFVRGRRVMWQGELVTPSQGEPVRFLETLGA